MPKHARVRIGASGTFFSPGAPASWRPYADTSPFNKVIPSSPTIHANSAAIVTKVTSAGWNSSKPADIPLGVSSSTLSFTSDYDHPLYFSTQYDPNQTIQPTADAYSGWSALHGTTVRIPEGAKGANGSDAHLSVIDLNAGFAWDFYHFQYTQSDRKVPAGGGNVIAKAGSKESLTGDGVVDTASYIACDAAGFGLAGLVIRPEELIAGEINHALSMIVKSTDGTFVSPAIGTAGSVDPTNAPPDGARFQLNMTFTEIDNLTAPDYRKTIWKAMSKYGMYVRDTGSTSWYVSLASGNPYITAGQADPWRTFASAQGMYYYTTGDYYLLELHPAGSTLGVHVPDWANKLRVLDWTDAANR